MPRRKSGAARRGRKRSRATLRLHLEGQWVRGRGSPYERLAPPPKLGAKAKRGFGPPPPLELLTLADVWPVEQEGKS